MPQAQVNGIDINYELLGDGFPLVLAHGFTGNLNQWESQIAPFSHKYRLLVYDSRGHGLSTVPQGTDAYTLDQYVDDQYALMQHLGVEHAYVGGLSMGGMIAMRFALKYPETLRALLLFDTVPDLDGMPAAPWQRDPAETEAIIMGRGVPAVLRGYWEATAKAGLLPPIPMPETVKRAQERALTFSPYGYLGGAKAMREQTSVRDRLGEIAVPTLVLVGDHDVMLPKARDMRQRIPGSRFVVIRNAPHGTAAWQPEAFNRAALDFLAAVARGEPVAGEFEV